MKKFTFLIAIIAIVSACSTKKNIQAQTTDVDINGTWTMTNYSAFAPNIPEIEDGDIVWNINLSKNSVRIVKKLPEKHGAIGPAQGEHFARKNSAIIRVGEQMYFYSLTGENLTLDSNIDPMLSNDLPVLSFKRIGK